MELGTFGIMHRHEAPDTHRIRRNPSFPLPPVFMDFGGGSGVLRKKTKKNHRIGSLVGPFFFFGFTFFSFLASLE